MKARLKVKSWFKNLLIKNKIIIIYIPLIMIPLCLLGFIANYFFSRAIIDKTIKNSLDESKLIITRLEVMLGSAESCANIILTDLNMIRLIEKGNEETRNPANSNPNQVSDLKLGERIRNQLKFASMAFPDIESVAYIDLNRQLFCLDHRIENGLDKAWGSGILQAIDASNGHNVWFPMQTRDYLTTIGEDEVITLGKKILDIDTGDKMGVLILNIKESSLAAIYENIGPLKRRGYYIVDDKGTVVSSQNKSDLLKPVSNPLLRNWILSSRELYEVKRMNGKNVLVTRLPVQKMGWRLVCEIPLEELTVESRRVTAVIFVIGLICLVFAISSAGILSKVIATPLVRLAKNMGKVKEGNLEVFCTVNSTDEVGLLASGFNTMIGRVKELLKKVETEQRKKREYELALFQAQIKPHFLYNTLDLIYVLCKMGDYSEAQSATKSLADFYRAALSKGNEVVTIGEEMKCLQDYLAIQKLRYAEVFDYEFRVQADILDSEILKLTVQPLVENSLYHGLKEKGSPGRIVVEGNRLEDTILISVTDDGVGIPVEIQKDLLAPRDDTRAKTFFGLHSVHERIKLYFGKEFGVQIHSEAGKGTKVILTLPARRKEYV